MKKKFLAIVCLAGVFSLASCGSKKDNPNATESNTTQTNDAGNTGDNTTSVQKENITGITFSDKAIPYDGQEHSLEIDGDLPTGVTATYIGGGTDVGEYTVTVSFTDTTGKYIVPANMTAKLTITKAEYDLSNISFVGADDITYDGNVHALAITGTLPEGVTVAYENNENVNAGEYTVTATFTGDENHEAIASMTAKLTINKATYDMSQVKLEDKVVTYDGTTQSIAITGTLPEGVTVTYEGNDKISADIYTVTAKFTGNENYNDIPDMTATLSITPATYDLSGISFNDVDDAVYDGEVHALAITGTLPEGVTVTYENNENVNAGEYTVTAKFTGDSNHTEIASMTADITINKATYDMSKVSFEDDEVTYDGEVHALAITGTLPEGVTVAYENNENYWADTFTVIAKFTGNENYNDIPNMTATLTINKATYDMSDVSFEDMEFTYDGEVHSLCITGELPDSMIGVSYIYNDQVNAGEYTVTAYFVVNLNYEEPSPMTAKLTINKATYDMSQVKLENKVVTYDGTTQSIAITGTLPEGVTVTYEGNDKIAADIYTVTAKFTGNENYNDIPDMTATLSITPATYDLSGISFNNVDDAVYDGEVHALAITGTLPEGVTVTYENNENITVGTYTVTAKFTGDSNHTEIASMTADITINKATYDMSKVSFEDAVIPSDGLAHTLEITGTLPEGVSVSYDVTNVTAVGEYPVTAKFTGNENYNDISSMSATLKIFDSSACDITDSGNVKFNDNTANLSVRNNQTTYDLSSFEVSYGASYKVYTNSSLPEEITNMIVNLKEGDNSFIIVVTSYNNSTASYEVNIHRNIICTITFETCFEEYIDSIEIEETLTIDKAPDVPKIAGYTYVGWSEDNVAFDFSYTVTASTTLTADYKANEDTHYEVHHYIENLEDDKYSVYDTENLCGITDTATAAKTVMDLLSSGFHLREEIQQDNINGDGSTIVYIYYERDRYTISLDEDSVGVGTITGLPTEPVKSSYVLNLAVSDINLGYQFKGFYIDGKDYSYNDELANYCVTSNITLSVFEVKDEMKNFEFESTTATCVVTGLKSDAIVTDLVMPEYVTGISEGAFKNNTDIKTITINNSIKTVGQFAFGGCTSVTTITMPGIDGFANTDYQKLFKTDSSTYSFNKNGVKLIISNEITSICNYQFSYIEWMNEIVLPETVKTLGQGALKECKNLKTVTLPSNVSVISTDLFQMCTSLTTVNFNKDKVRKIGAYAFYGCSALESIDMPNYLFSIDGLNSYAFAGCTSLKSITIPKGVDRIDNSLFSSCTSLESVEILSTSIKLIQPYAFRNCTSLKSITIPNTVTTIGEKAFNKCINLNSIVIPDSVTSIGKYAFLGCSNLTSAVISKNITAIPEHVFAGCSKLATITMPIIVGTTAEETNNTYNNLFYDDVSTPKYDYAKDVSVDLIINNDITSVPDSIFCKNIWLNSITLPSTVKTIERAAFSSCTNLSSVNLPYGLTTIEVGAFVNCGKLTSIDIPVTVTTIGNVAFADNVFTSIVFPEYVTALPEDVVSGATSLESVYIMGKLTSIGSSAFSKCSKLTDIYYYGTEAEWNAITGLVDAEIPSTVTMHYNYEAPQSTMAIIRDAGAITFKDNAGAYDIGGANTIDLSAYITVNKDATFVVAKDADGTELWKDKLVNLELGENTVYIIVTSPNGKITNTYTLTINRQDIVTVSYNSPAKDLPSAQNYSVGDVITELPTSTYKGYTLKEYQINGEAITLPYTVTESVTIDYIFEANTNTAYQVRHYLQNANDDEYTLDDTDDLTGTTDTETAITARTTYTHFVAQEITQKTILGDGSTVIDVYYNREVYTITIDNANRAGFTIANNGQYKYGADCTITLGLIYGSHNKVDWTYENTEGTKVLADKDEASVTFTVTENATINCLEEKDEFKIFKYSTYANGSSYQCVIKKLLDADITKLVIPEGVTEIQDDECKYYSITELILPDSFVQFHPLYYSWAGNENLVSVKNAPASIGENVFKNCTSLKTFEFNPNLTGRIVISSSAFEGCTALESVVFPSTDDSNTYLNLCNNAFKGCTSLKTFTANNLAFVLDNAFEGCTSLETLDLKSKTKTFSIYEEAFKGCTKLTTVTISANCTYLATTAFDNIGDNFKTINFRGTEEQWAALIAKNSVVIPDGVTVVCNYTDPIA